MGSKSSKIATSPYKLSGAKSPQGNMWAHVRAQGSDAFFSMKEATRHRGKSIVQDRLADAGMLMFPAQFNEFWKDVMQLREFPNGNILEQQGWNGLCFGLPDRTVFAPPGEAAVAVYDQSDGCEQSGTLKGWKSVVKLLKGQHLAIFLIAVAFVAPILKLSRRIGNFGFELVGEAGKGKSTLLYLAASTCGRAVGQAPYYWDPCNTTVNALEEKARKRSDIPLMLDDATTFAGSDAASSRAALFKQFVMSISHAQTKHRLGGPAPEPFRTVILLTSNQAISSVLAPISKSEQAAAGDRLLTLDLGVRKNRNFDALHPDFKDTAEYAARLEEGISQQFGTAMPAFLDALVKERSKDETQLRATIDKYVDGFIDRMQADRMDGSAKRVAEAFGLAVAGGSLAQHFKVLPKCFDIEKAARVAYRLFLTSTSRTSPRNRLVAYLEDPQFIDLDARKSADLSDEDFKRAPGFIKKHSSGKREHLVWDAAFKHAFPDYGRLLASPELKGIYFKDKDGHRGRMRTLREGKAQRMLVFRLGDDALAPVKPKGRGKA